MGLRYVQLYHEIEKHEINTTVPPSTQCPSTQVVAFERNVPKYSPSELSDAQYSFLTPSTTLGSPQNLNVATPLALSHAPSIISQPFLATTVISDAANGRDEDMIQCRTEAGNGEAKIYGVARGGTDERVIEKYGEPDEQRSILDTVAGMCIPRDPNPIQVELMKVQTSLP